MDGDIAAEAKKVPDELLTVGVAISGRKSSRHVVRWALEKFSSEDSVSFKLLHVRPVINSVPTPMGNSIPILNVREDVAAAYRKEIESQALKMLAPYKKICFQRKVQVDVMTIESDSVENAIAKEVDRSSIIKLVIGASSRSMFSWKSKGQRMSSRISVCIPSFCTVYAVSKEKLSSIRPSDSERNGSFRDDCSNAMFSTSSSHSGTPTSQTESAEVISVASYLSNSASLAVQRLQALSTINQGFRERLKSNESNHLRVQSLDVTLEEDAVSNPSNNSDVTRPISHKSSKSLISDWPSSFSDQVSTPDDPSNRSSSEEQVDFNLELEKLRNQLQLARGRCEEAQSGAVDASRKLDELNKHRLEETMKVKEINAREEKAKELARQEKEMCEAAIREAEYLRQCTEREALQKQEAETKAMRDAKEKENFEKALAGDVQRYRTFTWEEIVSATSSFSDSLKIGMGAYGTVYKGIFHHTTAAVKVLHSKKHDSKQFDQEVDILSKIRHPHLLNLFGACPDHSCLVYEYMKNGSLEDRLLRLNNTPAIPWFERYRIAWEVGSALVFLHNSKPVPIVHRDLKPANILLDHNLVSKIGDIGLSTMLQSDDASVLSEIDKKTGPVGTLCYIDPEYQRTGLISLKSDVYAFGIIILQLLTSKPAMALAHLMETSIEDGELSKMLDDNAGNWPQEETMELALLGLKCAELRRKDRPDLQDTVLPTLERLKQVADTARNKLFSLPPTPPKHFICPVLKEVMVDPCVAMDGYTYDRSAIEKWLQDDDKSPVTNMTLPNKNLLPNYTLLCAIQEWRSKRDES